MRLVIWNCAGALHRKFDALLKLSPDIAIIPEACERARLPNTFDDDSMSYEWVGNIPYKGLGVLIRTPFTVETFPPNLDLEWTLPLRVHGPIDFDLIAVWAMNHRASKSAHGPDRDRQVIGALNDHKRLLDGHSMVVAGDFNDSKIWDKPGGRTPFADTLQELEQRGLRSAYHETRHVDFGLETEPTLYWRDRKVDGPKFHIDYCFMPAGWVSRTRVEVGGFEEWVGSKLSDHAPLIVDVSIPW